MIPKSLQAALPYTDKPKRSAPNANGHGTRIAVVNSPHEQKIAAMMKMIRANYAAKKTRDKKETEHRVAKFKAEKNAIEMRKLKRQKELKKKICRTISRMSGKKSAAASSSAGKH